MKLRLPFLLTIIFLLATSASAQSPPSAVTLPAKPRSVPTKPATPCNTRDFIQAADTGTNSICDGITRLWVDLGSGGGGGGTVTTVSVTTANGISGTVANPTTTPAISLDISGLNAAKIGGGGVSTTEFDFLGTLTSDPQTQLNAKAPAASPTFTGTVVIPTPFTLGAVSVLPTGTELNFVDGVTGAIQPQLDAKQATITFGANVQTALGVAIGSAGAPVLLNGVGGTPSSMTGTNISGTAAGLTAGNVTTNANLTGHVTSTGNAALLGSFTVAQLNTAISDADVATGGGTATGTNTGDNVEVAAQAVGFTITKGTTPKTLTVALDANVAGTNTGDQDLSGKADLASPALTGTPTAPTAAAATNTTQVATTAHVFAERSNAFTQTNKTYDTEGTGNAFTSTFKTFFPAAGCDNITAASFWDLPTATPAVAACVTGSNTQKGVLTFADTSGGFSAQTTTLLPADFSGTVDARIVWRTAATSGNAKFSLSTICTAVDATETDDPAFNTASTVITAAAGTTLRLQTSAITSVTITGCVAGEFLHLKLFRDGNDGSDTLTASLDVIGVEITTRRAQ